MIGRIAVFPLFDGKLCHFKHCAKMNDTSPFCHGITVAAERGNFGNSKPSCTPKLVDFGRKKRTAISDRPLKTLGDVASL
jgi:hypothetical protein